MVFCLSLFLFTSVIPLHIYVYSQQRGGHSLKKLTRNPVPFTSQHLPKLIRYHCTSTSAQRFATSDISDPYIMSIGRGETWNKISLYSFIISFSVRSWECLGICEWMTQILRLLSWNKALNVSWGFRGSLSEKGFQTDF